MQTIRNKKTTKTASPLPVRKMLRGKIHRATVTDANLNYEGSITVDKTLMEAMDLIEFESVHVWDVNNGERFETYVLEGERDSGVICVNGAAARKVARGDLIIIGAFTWLDEESARKHQPKVVMVDGQNRVKEHPLLQTA
jgi:aspartate 1-decarboxylase